MSLPEVTGKRILILSENSEKLDLLAGRALPEGIVLEYDNKTNIACDILLVDNYSTFMNSKLIISPKTKIIFLSSSFESDKLSDTIKLKFILNKISPEVEFIPITVNKEKVLLSLLLLKYQERHLIYLKDLTIIDKFRTLCDDKFIAITDKDNDSEKLGKFNMFSKDVTYRICFTNSIIWTHIKEVNNLHLFDNCHHEEFIPFIAKKRLISSDTICLYHYFDLGLNSTNKNKQKINADYKIGFVPEKGLCVMK